MRSVQELTGVVVAATGVAGLLIAALALRDAWLIVIGLSSAALIVAGGLAVYLRSHAPNSDTDPAVVARSPPLLAKAPESARSRPAPAPSFDATPIVAALIKNALTPSARSVAEQTIHLDAGSFEEYKVALTDGEQLVVNITSDTPLDIYVLNNRNYKRFENGEEEFSYDEGAESAVECALDFTAPRTGTWFVVVDNDGEDDAIVAVEIQVIT